MHKNLEKIWNFNSEIEKLKAIHRTTRTLDSYRNENSAEHSWQASITALTLKSYYPHTIDINKVMKMLLIHDLGEIYTGDTWLFDEKRKKDAYGRELSSLKKLLGLLPSSIGSEFLELWKEFEDGKTHESKYAKIIDSLIALINHFEVSPQNYNPEHLKKEQVINKKIFIKELSPEIWELALHIIEKSYEKGLYS